MRHLPLEVLQREFSVTLRGYSRKAVRSFLEEVAQDLEDLRAENLALSEQIKGLSARLESYQRMEQSLKDSLILAERAAEDCRHNARREADLILEEARQQESALESELRALRSQRDRARAELIGLLQTHLAMLGEPIRSAPTISPEPEIQPEPLSVR